MTNTLNASSQSPHLSQAENTGLVPWCVAFGIVACVIILSNAVTMAAFRNSRLLLRLSMYFLVNLSIADMTVGAVALPMYVYLLYTSPAVAVKSAMKRLKVFQNVHISIDIFTGMASVFTLTAIAFERLVAISFPIYYHTLGRTTYLVMLSGIWFLAGTLSGTRILAYNGTLPEEVFIYSLVLLSVASLCFIVIAYSVIWAKLKLWSNTQHRIAGEKERNLAMAIGLVTAAFLVTWLPFHILNIIVNFKSSLLAGIPYEVIYVVKLSHYSNSFMNPIIYSFKIPEFRRAVQSLFVRRVRLQTTRV